MGTLPPAGLKETVSLDVETGLDVETEVVKTGLLAAIMAFGGLLMGVEAAETK